jgi:hypothetical protein
MIDRITCFKIRIESIDEYKVHFELFVGDRYNDTFVNTNTKGGYGSNSSYALEYNQFKDFVNRLFAYVYYHKSKLDNEKLNELNLNIYNSEVPQLSKLIVGPNLKDKNEQ